MEGGADSKDGTGRLQEDTGGEAKIRSVAQSATSSGNTGTHAPESLASQNSSSSGTRQTDMEKIRSSADPSQSDEGDYSTSDSSEGALSDPDETSPTSDREVDDDDRSEEISRSRTEKSTLRKGKWVAEEEEYTSRVIQHFSAGLLTLPEGATLRSYLAEKLSCDPMRITKKFTGACCLGRRVYHLRDRPRASQAELEMAQAERDHLEQRFKIRIEQIMSGLPLSRRSDLILSQPTSQMGSMFPIQSLSAGSAMAPWLQNYGSGLGGAVSNALGLATASNALGLATASNALGVGLATASSAAGLQVSSNGAALAGNALGLTGANPATILASVHQLLPGGIYPDVSRFPIPGSTDVPLGNKSDPSLLLLNNLVASWAAAQVAAALPPSTLPPSTLPPSTLPPVPATLPPVTASLPPVPAALPPMPANPAVASQGTNPTKMPDSQGPRVAGPSIKGQLKNAYEVQRKEEDQRQLRAAFEEQKERVASEKEQSPAAGIRTTPKAGSQADRDSMTQKSVISPAERLQRSYEAHLQSLGQQSKESVHSKQSGPEPNKSFVAPGKKNEQGAEKAMDDEEAGTVLLGFLNSLRQSYEDAVEKKDVDASNGRSNSIAEKLKITKPIPATPANLLRRSYEDAIEKKDSGTSGMNPKAKSMVTESTHASLLRQSYADAIEKKDASAPGKASNSTRVKPTMTKPTSGSSRPFPSTAKYPPEVDMTPDDRADHTAESQFSKVHSSLSDGDSGRNLSTAVSHFMNSDSGQKRPASVTDISSGNSSSQSNEFLSSMEDSSDKTDPSDDSSDKSDHTSSEEEMDEKDEEPPVRSSKGPPRKRLKGAFTQENLMAHSRRMSEGSNYN